MNCPECESENCAEQKCPECGGVGYEHLGKDCYEDCHFCDATGILAQAYECFDCDHNWNN